MKTEPGYKIKIIAGLHKDAELNIQSGIRYTVGSGDDCDIILMDSGIEKQHFCFTLIKEGLQLEKIVDDVYVDGKALPSAPFLLGDFQVVSIGDAHLSMGPGNQAWPLIEPPRIETDAFFSTCRDLVPIYTTYYQPRKYDRFLALRQFAKQIAKRSVSIVSKQISMADKKVLAAVCSFLLCLSIFFFDIWQPFSSVEAMIDNYTKRADISHLKPESTLLSIAQRLSNVGHNTFVSTGLAEPTIPVEVKVTSNEAQPIDHLRRALRNTWGQSLFESHVDDKSIYFKGFDSDETLDLALEVNRNEEGEIYASATTLTKKKKKELLSQIGDTICLKVNSAEDMENVCKRVLEKKGVRKAKAVYDIEEKSFTLDGRTDNQDTIPDVHDIVSKAFPDIKIKNNVKVNAPVTEQLHIRSICNGAIPHVISNKGVKIFEGGKLENGCTLVDIQKNHLKLRCDGSERMHEF